MDDTANSASPFVPPAVARRPQQGAPVRNHTARRSAVAAAVILALASLVDCCGSVWAPVTPGTSPTPSRTTVPSSAPTPNAPANVPPNVSVGQLVDGPGELASATLTLSWSSSEASECDGRWTFNDGASDFGPSGVGRQIMILDTMYLDVDRDGPAELLASIVCRIGQWGPMQLVAFESGPSPTLLGVVLEADPPDGAGPVPAGSHAVAVFLDYAGLADGTIQVDVGDRLTCCGVPVESMVRQQRTYEWTGSSFAQIAGPTTFAAGR